MTAATFDPLAHAHLDDVLADLDRDLGTPPPPAATDEGTRVTAAADVVEAISLRFVQLGATARRTAEVIPSFDVVSRVHALVRDEVLDRGHVTPERCAKLVALAVRDLDAVRPDWRDAVDVATLDLVSPTRCVVAQVFGGYGVGLATLYGAGSSSVSLGEGAIAFTGAVPVGYWLAAIGRETAPVPS